MPRHCDSTIANDVLGTKCVLIHVDGKSTLIPFPTLILHDQNGKNDVS